MNVLHYSDISDFKSIYAFTDYKDLLQDKVHEDDNKLPNKESKIYRSKIMQVKFKISYFKYSYDYILV